MVTKICSLAIAAMISFGPQAAFALPPIANKPPSFRIYDVDRREKEMRRVIGQLDGTPALSRRAAGAALGRLDRTEDEERVARARNGGRLDLATIRTVDAELNALSRRLGLREPQR